ncbi:hypothetical protein ACPPVO_33040 [Dactylosporangium sp. McL0621]|uniref:hypothetical protein n=1 Tax=Dactylosporangium sp. McL0621 TaxID=3415678 RepID=UPI003CEC8302
MTTLPRRSLLAIAALGGAAAATGLGTASWAAPPAADPQWYAPIRDAIAGPPDGAAGAPPTATAGKSGARYGYSAAIAATADAATRLVYSVNATDAKAESQAPTIQRLIAAGTKLLLT